MKKYIALTILVGLVVWGAYDIAGTKDKGKAAPVAGVQNAKTSSAGESTDPAQGQQLTVGLEKGNLAPDFELQTIEGKNIKLSSLKGKKVLVNFWATWCPPCRLEMPEMESYYEKNKNADLEFLAVNLTVAEKSQADVPAFLKENGITFPVLVDEKGNAAQLYDVSSIPVSFILDSQGVIQQKIVGPMTYEMMDKMLGEVK